ncbi:MAG: hypothetical protein ABI797_04910 [Chloroflexota bacterium]
MTLRLAPIVLLVAACGLAGPGATNPPTNPPIVLHTTAPSAVASIDRPPDGVLAVASNRMAGWLGTYCWNSRCLDAPELPDKIGLPSLIAPAGAELTFNLGDGSDFYEWSASYFGYPDGSPTELGSGGAFYDPYTSATPPAPLDSASFAAPPIGDWVIGLFVSFNEGDASYSWLVSVN